MALEIIDAYTNINFTDKQREDPTKIYDLFNSNGILTAIIDSIPTEEYNSLMKDFRIRVQRPICFRISKRNPTTFSHSRQ
jgi:hypothetical protein